MNALKLTRLPLVSRCAFEGDLPGFHSYEKSDPGGLRATERVLKELLEQGFNVTNIALLGAPLQRPVSASRGAVRN
jgi:hypothetical protein